VIPEKSVVNVYTDIIEKNYEKITQNVKQTKSLIKMRDSLLPKLISGEVSLIGERVQDQIDA
jgi:type I restriction enzyme S subunit